MPVLTYKCPSCDAGLRFDPDSQKYKCDYCQGYFTQEQVDAVNPAKATETQAQPETSAETQTASQEQGAQNQGAQGVIYSCPSCGASVVTDETTAATFCYYCHNPVVLSGRLDGTFLPDKIIPFAINKQKAVDDFLAWAKKKRFIPRAFFSKKQIEKISGVYFPYWYVNCDVQGSMQANATRVRTWRTGNREYTETQNFVIYRDGDLHFSEIIKNALKKADEKLTEGVEPFDIADMKDFSMPLLTGFLAEKRDMEKTDMEPELDTEIRSYTESLFKDSAPGYATITPEFLQANRTNTDWNYVLLPVWLLTYIDKKKKTYFYAMNGQTGKVCGKLPIDFKRLLGLFGMVAGPLLAISLLLGYLL